MRHTDRVPLPDFNAPSGDLSGDKRFGSSHAGGFHMLLADGSVQFVSYSIDSKVFEHLGNRSDGQVIAGAF